MTGDLVMKNNLWHHQDRRSFTVCLCKNQNSLLITVIIFRSEVNGQRLPPIFIRAVDHILVTVVHHGERGIILHHVVFQHGIASWGVDVGHGVDVKVQ